MKLQRILATVGVALVLGVGDQAWGSDHFDGPSVLDAPTTDITDMYVFPSPRDPGRLVLVQNVYPQADKTTWFSDLLEYRFRLRPVSIAGTRSNAGFRVGTTEIVFSCTFERVTHAAGRHAQQGQCKTPEQAVETTVNQAGSEDDFAKAGIRIFAGLRADPFFMDVTGFVRSFKEGKLDFTGKNLADGKNVLSLVLEIDAARFLPDPRGMYGVVSELKTRGSMNVVLDTFGRPEVTNVILSDPSFDTVNSTFDLRDQYNRYDPFGKAGPYAGPYRARFDANLHRIDSLDGRIDWPLKDGAHPLSALQLADFTVVDLSKPAGMGSWFEIERAIVAGRPHQTGGGRTLNDDICDIQYTFLVARDRERVSDGVDRPTKPAGDTFPYLRDPIALNQG